MSLIREQYFEIEEPIKSQREGEIETCEVSSKNKGSS